MTKDQFDAFFAKMQALKEEAKNLNVAFVGVACAEMYYWGACRSIPSSHGKRIRFLLKDQADEALAVSSFREGE